VPPLSWPHGRKRKERGRDLQTQGRENVPGQGGKCAEKAVLFVNRPTRGEKALDLSHRSFACWQRTGGGIEDKEEGDSSRRRGGKERGGYAGPKREDRKLEGEGEDVGRLRNRKGGGRAPRFLPTNPVLLATKQRHKRGGDDTGCRSEEEKALSAPLPRKGKKNQKQKAWREHKRERGFGDNKTSFKKEGSCHLQGSFGRSEGRKETFPAKKRNLHRSRPKNPGEATWLEKEKVSRPLLGRE